MTEENLYAKVYKNGHKTFLTHEHEFFKRSIVSCIYFCA